MSDKTQKRRAERMRQMQRQLESLTQQVEHLASGAERRAAGSAASSDAAWKWNSWEGWQGVDKRTLRNLCFLNK